MDKRVLVTGGAGYVGSVLVPQLIQEGYEVRVVDCGFFGLDHVHPEAELIDGDILEFDERWLAGVEAVIHLAGLSNDPMAAFSPRLNYMLNAAGAAIVAHSAKEAGISRFVLGSTCSVYGMQDDHEVDEDGEASPTFPYAISKLMAERAISCLADDSFRPIILRKGTVVGWSPRMRFDLVINAMVKTALTQHEIVVHNPKIWRPLVDVEDAARAYVCALEAEPLISGIFNIAGGNYTMGALGEEVSRTLEHYNVMAPVEVNYQYDVRSYRVSTSKALNGLGFKATISVSETVGKIVTNILAAGLTDLDDSRFYNVKQMKKNMAKAQPQSVTI